MREAVHRNTPRKGHQSLTDTLCSLLFLPAIKLEKSIYCRCKRPHDANLISSAGIRSFGPVARQVIVSTLKQWAWLYGLKLADVTPSASVRPEAFTIKGKAAVRGSEIRPRSERLLEIKRSTFVPLCCDLAPQISIQPGTNHIPDALKVKDYEGGHSPGFFFFLFLF